MAKAVVNGREEILGRIRDALRDVPADERPEDVPVARDYRHAAEASRDDVLARFVERVGDYRATVRRVQSAEVPDAVDAACAEQGIRTIVVPPDLPAAWRPGGTEVREDSGLSPPALDAVDGALTGCAAAIAETGTLVLDGQGRSGRRVLTLIPDHHICIVEADQVVGTVPEAIARIAPAVIERRAPITLVSGPSATSDIELSRVEGVHGPRNLLVLVVDEAA